MQQNSRQLSKTRQDLMAFKSATAAAPTTELQVNRLLEQLQSTVSHLRAIAMPTATKGAECAKKGGHVMGERTSNKAYFCQECGCQINSTAELRAEAAQAARPASKTNHRLTAYWTDNGYIANYGR